MTPRVTSPVPTTLWRSVLETDEGAVVGQSLPWREAVLADGRFTDASVHYAFPSGREVVLPLVRRRRSAAAARVVSSWPQVWGTGGPISTDGRITADEAAFVWRDAARRGTLMTEVTLRPDADPAWLSAASHLGYAAEAGGSYLLDLAGGFDEVWKNRFRGTARTAVRKAEKLGVEVEVDRTGRLAHVYDDLHERSVRRRAATEGEPVWLSRWRMSRVGSAPAQVAGVAAAFGKDCATWVARRDGEPVAAIIVLSAGGHAKYWRGAMDKDLATPSRANDLLHRLAIEEACDQGRRWYDMGGAHPDSALAAFKTKLGAALHHTHELRARRLPARVGHGARMRAETLVKRVAGLKEM
ncbi:GNAT family N-acetyltransferase [Pseudonocardia sp. RS11V-5]|uniref:GNAT family N-acetyltransferase n=1 Tax=Pseudonocardia terrae TaxID=2905831 RepID=UPI001E54167A|nr:GNAT family N-acetyltransferase [Pseudonocardia terrae]MCE3553464.1 GNAT family N-acetyltransferase [Pseudonocardia terrae]